MINIEACDPSKRKCWTKQQRTAYLNKKVLKVLAVKNYILPENYQGVISHELSSIHIAPW
jgi:hypothetical protein